MRKKKKSYRKKPHRPFYKKKAFWYSSSLLVFLSLLTYLLFFYPTFQIKRVIISGNERVPLDELTATIDELIDLRFYHKSIFFVSKRTIARTLLEFPEIKSVAVKRSFPNLIKIEVEERVPFAVWCHESCFLLDKEGVIFHETDGLSGLIVRGGELDAKIGEAVLKEEELHFVDKFLDEIGGVIEASQVVIDGISAEILTSDGWYIIVLTEESPSLQAKKLLLTLSEEVSKNKALKYIDVRFESRAYIQYQ